MADILRRLRGVLGTGLSWGLAWAVLGAVLHVLLLLLGGSGLLANSLLGEVFVFSFMGFGGGAFFSTGFSLTEGHRLLAELKISRGAAWGAVAGMIAPILVLIGLSDAGLPQVLDLHAFLLVPAGLGAASGAAMTTIARTNGPEVLSENEERDLLSAGEGPPVR